MTDQDDSGAPDLGDEVVASTEWATGAYVVENQLPSRVRVHGDRGHVLMLAPLERRTIEADALGPFNLESMRRGDDLFVAEQSNAEQDPSAIVGLTPFILGAYLYGGFTLDSPLFWFGAPLLAGIGAWIWLAKNKKGWTEVQRWAKQAVSLLLVIFLAIGVPAVVIWYSTGLDTAAKEAGSIGEALNSSPQFLARALQLLFIAAASLLPALMYFVFDREQLGTLRDRFIHQVFRLDPSLKRLGDMRAKYGPQIEEMYGPMRTTSRARLLGGMLSPIVVATLLLTVGWTLTLLNTDVVAGTTGSFPILSLFEPDASVVTFAFLGAYFFAIQLVLRSYLRGDLRPKTYGHIAVRLLIVLILAWVLQEIVGEPTTWLRAAVFLAGIVPETALRWIREFVRGRGPEWIKGEDSNLTEQHPLSNLEGIDLYDLTRLTEEGVTNVEALAHHELVELVLKTRIPAPRLVDWVDQAILYLHSRGDAKNGDEVAKDTLWSRLQLYGIRTATDLQEASNARTDKAEHDSFLKLLGKDEGPPFRVQVILDTLADDEWLGYIRHWRQYSSSESAVEIHAEHSQVSLVDAETDQAARELLETVINQTQQAMGALATLVASESPAHG